MVDWKRYKGEGPWMFTESANLYRYNEGAVISSSDNPVWENPNQRGGKPITPVHHPGCGYWHKHEVNFNTRTGFVTEFDGEFVYITMDDADDSGPYIWTSSDGEFELATTDVKNNVLELDDPCNVIDVSFTVENAAGVKVTYTVKNASLFMTWVTPLNTTIDPANPVTLEIDGGVGPYNWSVEGTDASLGAGSTTNRFNVLTDEGSGCGVYEVKVIDACGAEITLNVINITGTYELAICSDGGGYTYRDVDACTYEQTGRIFIDNGWRSTELTCSNVHSQPCEFVDVTCEGSYIGSFERTVPFGGLCRPLAINSQKWVC